MRLLGRQHIIIDDSKSKLGFATTGGGSWEVWDRFITYDGQQLFHIGNVCGTCNFFFTRQENKLDTSIATGELIATLNNGLTEIDIEVAKNYSSLFPNDTYEVLLLEIFPHLTFPNDKDDYFVTDLLLTWEDENNGMSEANTEYYRGSDRKVKDGEKLFEFFVPIYPSSKLSDDRIKHYENLIKQGQTPTALAIGVLDVKAPAMNPVFNGQEVEPENSTHWCFANYLLDGHHKIQAAHRQKKSITLLTYLSRGASWRLIDELLTYYKQ